MHVTLEKGIRIVKVSMVGIDYSKATIEEREQFSFTCSSASCMAHHLLKEEVIQGCVIVSTCNRTELWFSGLEEKEPIDLFLSEKLVDCDKYKELFVQRSGEEAITYLLELGCGIHSQIFGEDQILSQLKQALEQARENKYINSILDYLFQTAITAAKQVKTEVKLTREKTSVPGRVIQLLKERLGNLLNLNCMVIGNGEMGCMMSSALVKENAHVSITLRQYKRGNVTIPAGCCVIPYKDRVSYLADMDIIVSATTSPHYTIKKECLEERLTDKPYIFVDLAVPRDLDPQIRELSSNITLYNMDHLGMHEMYNQDAIREAKKILQEYKEEYISWYYFREWIPTVKRVSAITGSMTNDKLTKIYKKLELSSEEKNALKGQVEKAMEKSVAKLIFGLRDHLEREKWKDCMQALNQAVEEYMN